MRANTFIALASAISFVSAIPNPLPAPTAVEQRAASPMYCTVDGHGTRCVPDKARRTAAPEAQLEAREPDEPSTSSSLPDGCVADPDTGLVHCVPTEPTCTTFTGDDGITSTACVLKREATPTTLAVEVRAAAPKTTPAPKKPAHKSHKPHKSSSSSSQGFFSSAGALCTVENQQTRCVPNTPTCTTQVVSGETQVACVL